MTVVADGVDELRALSALDRLPALYEYGLLGCAERNAAQVSAVLVELGAVIDHAYGDLAHELSRLYRSCLEWTREGRFDDVAFVFEALRAAALEPGRSRGQG